MRLAASRLVFLLVLALAACGDFTGVIEDPGGQAFDDLPSASEGEEFSSYRVVSRWQKSHLTYFIANGAGGIPAGRQREIMAAALDAWSAVTPLTFSEVGSPAQADFVIGFGAGAHCELYSLAGLTCRNSAFEGSGGVLAHAYYPGQGGLSGEAHFDAGESWVDGVRGGVSLLNVAMHEFGHTLGLDHSEAYEAMMYPSYNANDVKVTLRADDIAGIQSIYGSNGSQPPPPPPPPSEPPSVPGCGSPSSGDADGDQVPDNVELYQLGTNPADCDTDDDGLPDYEAAYGLNPLNPDTDGDGASDGAEVSNGSNPYVPDQGGGGSSVAGVYQGVDSQNSPLVFQVYPNGYAEGFLRILYFGYPTDIPLTGGLDVNGSLLLVSYDYFFAFAGEFVPGGAQGYFQTMGGAYGTWVATRVSASREELIATLPPATVASDAYQPPIGSRIAPTMAVHQRVEWRER